MAELIRAAPQTAGGEPLATDTVKGVRAYEPDPGCQRAISGAKHTIGRHLLPLVISDTRVRAAGRPF